MVERHSTPTRKALQAEFDRASELRAARRAVVETLRAILAARELLGPTLMIKPDRRISPRDARPD